MASSSSLEQFQRFIRRFADHTVQSLGMTNPLVVLYMVNGIKKKYGQNQAPRSGF
jgi:hypothetical protein